MPPEKSISITTFAKEIGIHVSSLMSYIEMITLSESIGKIKLIKSTGNRIQILKIDEENSEEEIRNSLSNIEIKQNKILSRLDKIEKILKIKKR